MSSDLIETHSFDHPQHEDFALLLGQLLDAEPGFGDGFAELEGRIADGSGWLRNVFDGRRFADALLTQVCQGVVGCNDREPSADAASFEAFAEKLLVQSDEGVLNHIACDMPTAGDVVGEAEEPLLLKLHVAAELRLPVFGLGFLFRCGEQGLFEHFLKRSADSRKQNKALAPRPRFGHASRTTHGGYGTPTVVGFLRSSSLNPKLRMFSAPS